MARLSRQVKLYDTLADLKRHLNSCKDCISALKATETSFMCAHGTQLVIDAARGYDDIIRLRIAAHNHDGGHVYACPDLSKHGKAYALTAPALHVTGLQDRLF